MTKAVLLPFYCDGYREDIFKKQIEEIAGGFRALGLAVDVKAPIDTYEEALRLQKSLHPYAYDLVILLAATWSEPRLASVAARAFFGSPMIVFGINEFRLSGVRTEFSSAPASAALYGCFREMGIRAEFMTGSPSDPENASRIQAISAAASAISALRETRIGFFGHNFNGITEAGFDLSILRRRFGTEVYSFDGSQLIRRMESFTADDPFYEEAREMTEKKTRDLPEAYLDRVIRMTAGFLAFREAYGLNALSIRCHTEFSQEYGLSCCLPLSLIGNRMTVACEADLPVLFTEVILHLLSGGQTATYADLRTFTKSGMDVASCGFAPTDLTHGIAEVAGEKGYLTNKTAMNEGRLTLARMLKRPGGVLELHATGGEAADLPERLLEYGCAPYPMTHIKPDMDMARFMENVGANHYAIVYRDVMDALKVFSKYTGVTLLS